MENQQIQEITPACAHCRHFHRHYTRSPHGYIPLHVGHCSHPKLRDKQVDTPACHRFSKRPGEKHQ